MRAEWRRLNRDLGVLKDIKAWSDEAGKTCVEVDVVRPHLRISGRPRYRFTTEKQVLDPAGFPDTNLRGNIAHDANKERRRALFCVDQRTDLTLAALSFHVDHHRSVPLIVTDLAVREDECNALGLFAMAMLLDVLQDVAVICPNRADDEIGFVAANDIRADAAKVLGLRPCDTPKQLDKPGLYLCYRRRRSKRLAREGG
jgi:hypothetical protein